LDSLPLFPLLPNLMANLSYRHRSEDLPFFASPDLAKMVYLFLQPFLNRAAQWNPFPRRKILSHAHPPPTPPFLCLARKRVELFPPSFWAVFTECSTVPRRSFLFRFSRLLLHKMAASPFPGPLRKVQQIFFIFLKVILPGADHNISFLSSRKQFQQWAEDTEFPPFIRTSLIIPFLSIFFCH